MKGKDPPAIFPSEAASVGGGKAQVTRSREPVRQGTPREQGMVKQTLICRGERGKDANI